MGSQNDTTTGETLTTIEKGQRRLTTLKGTLEKFLPTIRDVVVKGLGAEELTRLALNAACRDAKILECTPESVCLALLNAAAIGLRPDGREGHIVPYMNNKKGRREAQFLPGYQGLVKLAYKSGIVDQFDAHCVRANDEFEFSYGLTPTLTHRPKITGDRGEIIAAYAIVRIHERGNVFRVLDKSDLNRRQQVSQKGRKNEGPWKEWPDEMSLKSACIALSKLVPLGDGFVDAAQAEESAMLGRQYLASGISSDVLMRNPAIMQSGADDDDAEPEAGNVIEAEATRTESDKLKERIGGGRKRKSREPAGEESAESVDDPVSGASSPLDKLGSESWSEWASRIFLAIARIPTFEELDAIQERLMSAEGVSESDKTDILSAISTRRDVLEFGDVE